MSSEGFFRKKAVGSSEHLCFGLVLKHGKFLCLLKSSHHLSRKLLRKIYRIYLLLWANMKRFVRNKRNHRVYFTIAQGSQKIFHEDQTAGMGVADLNWHEKTRKIHLCWDLCCFMRDLCDNDSFFAEAEERCCEWQL